MNLQQYLNKEPFMYCELLSPSGDKQLPLPKGTILQIISMFPARAIISFIPSIPSSAINLKKDSMKVGTQLNLTPGLTEILSAPIPYSCFSKFMSLEAKLDYTSETYGITLYSNGDLEFNPSALTMLSTLGLNYFGISLDKKNRAYLACSNSEDDWNESIQIGKRVHTNTEVYLSIAACLNIDAKQLASYAVQFIFDSKMLDPKYPNITHMRLSINYDVYYNAMRELSKVKPKHKTTKENLRAYLAENSEVIRELGTELGISWQRPVLSAEYSEPGYSEDDEDMSY